MDVALTQKIGKTWIMIEQNNGQMKQATRFFDATIPMNQLGLVTAIFRSSFLLQNVKLPFVQERSDDKSANRPCKAEICWYVANNDGLMDVCMTVGL